MPKQKLCAHYKTNGEQCEAVALKDDDFCYFHSRDRQRVAVIERYHKDRIGRLNIGLPANECHKQNAFNSELFNECSAALLHALELPVLEDAAAIQITVTNIIRMIALQQIDRPSAGLILYGLQIASGTLPRLRTEPFSTRAQAHEDTEPLRELAAAISHQRQQREQRLREQTQPPQRKQVAAESPAGDNAAQKGPTGTDG
jgi:hypothetical protein